MISDHLKVALIGSNGMLAQMVRKRAPENYALHCYDLPEFDITDRDQVINVLGDLSPDIIISCAAYTNVDGCETEQDLAKRVNGTAVGYLAEAAKNVDATLVQISTDYVFDGETKAPYEESDSPNPQSVYGHSKLLGEQEVIRSKLKRYFIVRTSWLYGPGGKNFVETIIRLAKEKEELRIVSDQVGTPTYTADLADAIFNLLALPSPQPPASSPWGLYHFSNEGQCSWHEFACDIVAQAQQAGETMRVKNIVPIKTEDYPLPAKRPQYSVLSKEKYLQATGADIPSWQDSLKKYMLNRES